MCGLCEGVLQELQSSREKLEDLWSARKLKLDLALQLRVFEQDALEVCAKTLIISSSLLSVCLGKNYEHLDKVAAGL